MYEVVNYFDYISCMVHKTCLEKTHGKEKNNKWRAQIAN